MEVDSVHQLTESFSPSSFPKQQRNNNYYKIQTIHKLAAIDAASVETTRGGGQHGYLAIVLLKDKTFYTLTGGTFMTPTNLGPTPTIEGGLEVAEIAIQ